MTTATYTIPRSRLSQLHKSIDKLNRRAVKLGRQPAILEELGSDFEQLFEIMANQVGPQFERVEVRLTQPEPIRLDGWQLAAYADLVEAKGHGREASLKALAGQSLPQRAFTADQIRTCEHCNKKRYRKLTFLVRKEETGEEVLVGSSCLGDFLGNVNAHQLVKLAGVEEQQSETVRTLASYSLAEMPPTPAVRVDDYLAVACAMVRQHGYTNRSTIARVATSQRVWQAIMEGVEVEQRDRDLARQLMEWVDRDHEDWFLKRIGSTVLGRTHFSHQEEAALAACLPEVWRIYQERMTRSQQPVAPVQDQEVGSREVYQVMVRDVRLVRQGDLKIIEMAADDQVLVTFTGPDRLTELTRGSSHQIAGNFRRVNYWKGERQSIINRVKVLS